jgi:hypothetical protein
VAGSDEDRDRTARSWTGQESSGRERHGISPWPHLPSMADDRGIFGRARMTQHVRQWRDRDGQDARDCTSLSQLPASFRERASLLRRYGAEACATAVEQCAADVEAALVEHGRERLSLKQAAAESGYSAGHLRRLVRKKKLSSAADGTVLRQDLPKKPGTAVADRPHAHASSIAQLARAVANGE